MQRRDTGQGRRAMNDDRPRRAPVLRELIVSIRGKLKHREAWTRSRIMIRHALVHVYVPKRCEDATGNGRGMRTCGPIEGQQQTQRPGEHPFDEGSTCICKQMKQLQKECTNLPNAYRGDDWNVSLERNPSRCRGRHSSRSLLR